jgi:acetylornithine deacetylase/succinyl-diaminopimelate desuccinylase-like protein
MSLPVSLRLLNGDVGAGQAFKDELRSLVPQVGCERFTGNLLLRSMPEIPSPATSLFYSALAEKIRGKLTGTLSAGARSLGR